MLEEIKSKAIEESNFRFPYTHNESQREAFLEGVKYAVKLILNKEITFPAEEHEEIFCVKNQFFIAVPLEEGEEEIMCEECPLNNAGKCTSFKCTGKKLLPYFPF